MLQFTVRLLTSWRNSKTIVAGLVASVTLGAIAFSLTFVSCIFLKLYAELGTNNTRTKQVFITNATKKSSDVLINTGVVLLLIVNTEEMHSPLWRLNEDFWSPKMKC